MFNEVFIKNVIKIFFLLSLFLFLTTQARAAANVTVNNPSSNATIGDSIILTVTLSNFTPSSQYYAKFRIGQSLLNDGETLNGSSWYSDSSDYLNFPIVTLDSSGSGSFQITGRAKISSAQVGANVFKIRMALISNTSNQEDSQGYSITLSPAPTSTPTSTPSPTPTNAPTNTPTPTTKPTTTPTAIPPTLTPAVLQTNAPTKQATSTPKSTEPPIMIPSDTPASSTPVVLGASEPDDQTKPSEPLKPFIISFALIGAGLGILSLVLLWQKRGLFLHSKPPDDIISP